MTVLNIEKIDGKMAIVLPDELVAELNLKSGDRVSFSPDSLGYRVRFNEATVAETMSVFREGRAAYNDALNRLAQ